MSIDFNMWRAISSTLNNRVAHDKESFKKDYNRFVLKQDELSLLANKANAEGVLDKFLSYCDDDVADGIDTGCKHHKYLSTVIENAYLVENLKVKFDGNKSFEDVARSVYDEFEGKVTPAEFVGSCAYTECFTGENFFEALPDKISEKDLEEGRHLDSSVVPAEYMLYPCDFDYYYIMDYKDATYKRESYIDLPDYAAELAVFEDKFDCWQYAGDTVKSRLGAICDEKFDAEVWQAGTRVYFNRSLQGGELVGLRGMVQDFMENEDALDYAADRHVVSEVMSDKLLAIAKDVSSLSCDGILKNKERAKVVCGVALEQFYRDSVDDFVGTRVIQSFVDNNKIKEPGKSKFYDDLKEYLDSNMRAKYDYAFDNKKTQSKRKRLNVPFEVDAGKQSTDDDDFDK